MSELVFGYLFCDLVGVTVIDFVLVCVAVLELVVLFESAFLF